MKTSKSSICLQNAVTGCPTDVIGDGNVLWSSGTAWQGVTAEAYHFEELATPEFQTVDYSLALHVSSPSRIELKTDGQRDARTRVSGDLAILPAATACQVCARGPHDVLVVAISPQFLAHTGLCARGRSLGGPLLHPYLRDAQVEHICRALKAEAESHYPSGTLYGESLALALAAYLFGQYSSSNKKGGMAPQALRRVIDYMEANLDTPLRLASLAEIAGLSAYRFAHNFRSAIGMPPHQYVLRKRLSRAKQMLRETNNSILEIACGVGCQSTSQFNALFKRETGTIPSAYRASFR